MMLPKPLGYDARCALETLEALKILEYLERRVEPVASSSSVKLEGSVNNATLVRTNQFPSIVTISYNLIGKLVL